jgi:lipopolysaccharide biosynthesis glycosyltransferase
MSKIYVFSERIGARRIVYMDPDVLVLRNIDHLFQRVRKGMMSAGPDNGLQINNARPNTGVIGTMPDQTTMQNLLNTIGTNGYPSYDGADQGFLTAYFVDRKKQLGWDKLRAYAL